MFLLKSVRNFTCKNLRSCQFSSQTSSGMCCETADTSVLPTQAQVIICGTGAVANSVAYHLVENGWTDVLLIDKGRLVHFLLEWKRQSNTELHFFGTGYAKELLILVQELWDCLNLSKKEILFCLV